MEERTRRRPRIADVAREAGVSKTAVSFAFNRPSRLAPETAIRIRTVAESLGYRPHPVARMLTQRSTRTIGLLTPQTLSVIFSNPFFGAFCRGRRARGRGRGLLPAVHLPAERVADARGGPGDGRRGGRDRCLGPAPGGRAAARRRPAAGDGRLQRPARPADGRGRRRRRGVRRRPAPDRPRAPRPADRRDRDRPRARRRNPPASAAAGCAATCAAIAEHGIELGEDAVVVAPSTIEGGMAALRGAWEDGLRPTGVLVMSDAMAIGVLRAARELGVDVPGDLSVVGLRRHRHQPAHEPAADDGPPADPAQGRGRRPQPPREDRAAGRGRRPATARDAPDHPRLDRSRGAPMRTRIESAHRAYPSAPSPAPSHPGEAPCVRLRRLTDRSEESMQQT